MPKRGIKKRILNKVSALFSIRGAKHRLEIHGEQKELDSNSPKHPDINTVRGVMSSKTPHYKPRGIRFSRRAVQRSKYLRQKFGVRKTVMGFSPRVGSITEEDESEITLWMLAENAENVISEGMAWLRNSEDCCDDSTGMEQEDHEKILQMWIQSNSFDKLYEEHHDDKDISHDDDYERYSFSEDDGDDSCDQKPGPTDDEDDNNDDDDDDEDDNDDDEEHHNEIIKDYDSTGDEDDDVTQDNDDINDSYATYDTDTDSDDEDKDEDEDDMDEDDHTVHNNENTGDSLNDINCSIYVDDESFDELDDDDDDYDGDDDDHDDSHEQLESSETDKRKESAIETKTIGNNLTRESYIAVLDSANSQDYNNIFEGSTGGNNDINMCEQTGCKENSEKISGFEDEVNGDDENRVESELTHDNEDSAVHVLDSRHDNDDDGDSDDDNNVDINQNDHTFFACNVRFSSKDDVKNNPAKSDLDLDVKTQHEQFILPEKGDQITPDDAVINTVKGEIDEILSRISQIESDFNFMRKSMNEFRSSDVQNNDTIQ